MSEMTKSMRINRFIELATTAVTDAQKLASQDYFMKEIMVGAPGTNGSLNSFMQAFSDVVSQIDQRQLQTPQTYDQLMDRLPCDENGVRHALRKVGLKYGATPAPGWN